MRDRTGGGWKGRWLGGRGSGAKGGDRERERGLVGGGRR